MWSMGKVFDNPEVVRVYVGSFWEQPLRHTVSTHPSRFTLAKTKTRSTNVPRVTFARDNSRVLEQSIIVVQSAGCSAMPVVSLFEVVLCRRCEVEGARALGGRGREEGTKGRVGLKQTVKRRQYRRRGNDHMMFSFAVVGCALCTELLTPPLIFVLTHCFFPSLPRFGSSFYVK